ncbi:NAD-dependent epimerase/dehydratase family protein [Pararhizobium mangrovi]|uniref:NAD(P)-dependent oxidoreductase n=1 Tax=Pararhizobium mangrovi TaxID=2590452 RepID=A0A506U7C4_9HYPH|nr:NAD(P)-dependent oxidoreductase [Pararhizobium mangrovi]TPW29001.1 NAD(P)-dependent oxidoreductase [Pararhizobium mangrovi]
MPRVLITGAAGFIGSHLTTACLDAGYEVHAIVRSTRSDQRISRLSRRISRHHFDLRDTDAIRRCMTTVEPHIIFHLAARTRQFHGADFDETAGLLHDDLAILNALFAGAMAAKRPPARIVRTGSLAEYGAAARPSIETDREAPVTPYGRRLMATTRYIDAVQPSLPFAVVAARLALVYGPGQSLDFFVPWLIEECLDGHRCIVRRPDDRRDLLHVADVVSALLRMATTPLAPGTIVNIASGTAPTMREVAEFVIAGTGADPRLVEYGQSNAPTGAPTLHGHAQRALDLLGWQAGISLADGIAATIGWHRNRKRLAVSDAFARPVSRNAVNRQSEAAS